MWSWSTNVTDRRTDGRTERRTTCDLNTALCTKVHRAVKIGVIMAIIGVIRRASGIWRLLGEAKLQSAPECRYPTLYTPLPTNELHDTATELRSVTCHMGSHSVTCHPTRVNTPHLNPSQTGRYSIYPPRRDGRLSWRCYYPASARSTRYLLSQFRLIPLPSVPQIHNPSVTGLLDASIAGEPV